MDEVRVVDTVLQGPVEDVREGVGRSETESPEDTCPVGRRRGRGGKRVGVRVVERTAVDVVFGQMKFERGVPRLQVRRDWRVLVDPL